MKLKLSSILGASMLALMSYGSQVSAAECQRGDLDERFCDVDGDLIADIPSDPSQQIDPDTLILNGEEQNFFACFFFQMG